MSIVETALIFVGIPAAAILVVAALVYGRAAIRTPRYRPGNAWRFEPAWYLPHPEHAGPASSLPASTLDGRALAGQVAEPVAASGGASGEW